MALSKTGLSFCCGLFPVQEKMKGKNKLVPRLLGITKESVVRVDEKTKEVCFWLEGCIVQCLEGWMLCRIIGLGIKHQQFFCCPMFDVDMTHI